jgi:hypothetical protein
MLPLQLLQLIGSFSSDIDTRRVLGVKPGNILFDENIFKTIKLVENGLPKKPIWRCNFYFGVINYVPYSNAVFGHYFIAFTNEHYFVKGNGDYRDQIYCWKLTENNEWILHPYYLFCKTFYMK